MRHVLAHTCNLASFIHCKLMSAMSCSLVVLLQYTCKLQLSWAHILLLLIHVEETSPPPAQGSSDQNTETLQAFTQELRPYQQSHKLVSMPSLLEWLSYIFASGNLLAGPFFELRDYRDYIERQGPWEKGFPSSVAPGLARLLKAMLCMAFHLRMTQGFNASTLESAWYHSQPLLSR